MKQRMMKKERFWDNVVMVLNALASVMFIASIFIKDKAIWIPILALGWALYIMAGAAKGISHDYAIMYIKEDIASISYAINTLAENVRQELYGTDEEESEADTKES